MSNDLDKKIANFEKADVFDKIAGVPESKLEETLIEAVELNDIYNLRFKNYKSVSYRAKLPIDLIVIEFVNYEKKLVQIILSKRQSKETAKDVHLTNRSIEYNQFLLDRINSGNEVISNTFFWNGYQENQSVAKEELVRLYNGLRGLNSGHIAFLSKSVSKEEFIKLFTGRILTRRIHWDSSVSLLVILMDFVSSTFLDIPEDVQKSIDKHSDKELREWLGGKMIDLFVYGKEGTNEFTRSKISSIRSKIDTLKLRERSALEGILNSIIIDD